MHFITWMCLYVRVSCTLDSQSRAERALRSEDHHSIEALDSAAAPVDTGASHNLTSKQTNEPVSPKSVATSSQLLQAQVSYDTTHNMQVLNVNTRIVSPDLRTGFDELEDLETLEEKMFEASVMQTGDLGLAEPLKSLPPNVSHKGTSPLAKVLIMIGSPLICGVVLFVMWRSHSSMEVCAILVYISLAVTSDTLIVLVGQENTQYLDKKDQIVHDLTFLCFVEMVKLVASLILWMAFSEQKENAFEGFTVRSTGWMLVAAAGYGCNNFMLLHILHQINLAVYAVVKESAIIFVGLFWSLAFGLSLTKWRWVSFAFVFAGSLAVHYREDKNPASANSGLDSAMVLLMVFVGSFSGVANEKSMKVRGIEKRDLMMQNALLYAAMTILFTVAGLAFFHDRWHFGIFAFLRGRPLVAVSLLVQAALGLSASALFRFSTSPTKAAMGSLRPLVLLLAAVLIGQLVSLPTAVGAMLAAFGVGIYVWQGPLGAPKEEEKATGEAEVTVGDAHARVLARGIIGIGVLLPVGHLIADQFPALR